LKDLRQRDVAITSNPEDRLQTFHVTILDRNTGELIQTLTHNYSIEECALDIKENMIEGFEAVKIFQPDSKATLNQSNISEL